MQHHNPSTLAMMRMGLAVAEYIAATCDHETKVLFMEECLRRLVPSEASPAPRPHIVKEQGE